MFAILTYSLMRAQVILPSIAPGITAVVAAVIVLIASKSHDLLVPSGSIRSFLVYLGERS